MNGFVRLVRGICDWPVGFGRLGFVGKRPFVRTAVLFGKADWGGESVIALWVLRDWVLWGKRPFVKTAVLLEESELGGESVITLWVLGNWILWGKRPFVRTAVLLEKPTGAGNLRLSCRFWEIGFVGKRPFVRRPFCFLSDGGNGRVWWCCGETAACENGYILFGCVSFVLITDKRRLSLSKS